MNNKPTYSNTTISSYILNVVNNTLVGILGIQITLAVLPLHTGDKRFNQ